MDRRGAGIAGIDAELYADLDAMRTLAIDVLDSPPAGNGSEGVANGAGYLLPDASVVVSASAVGEGRAVLRYNFSSNDADVAHYHRPNGLSRLSGKASHEWPAAPRNHARVGAASIRSAPEWPPLAA